MKKLVICICTYKRNKSLTTCLKSLEKINNSKKIKITILIVDNTINYQSFELVKKIKKKFKFKIIQINEKRRGVVHARNKALKKLNILNPTYVSFIDDDCTVNKLWLKNILRTMKEMNADIVTGPQIYSDRKKKINYTKYFEKKYNSNIERVKWAATNNVFFLFKIIKNKKIFFDKHLNKFGMGEDQLFFSKLNNMDYKIYWSEDIKVNEKDHSHRFNIYWLMNRSFRLGVLGNYIDKKLHGNFFGYIYNYLKCIFYFLNMIIFVLKFLNKNSRIKAINFLFRFLGRLVGPFIFNKINFLK